MNLNKSKEVEVGSFGGKRERKVIITLLSQMLTEVKNREKNNSWENQLLISNTKKVEQTLDI